ncbi:MAG TPA: alpha/beta hydrolase domain-containing protein [Ramlibacter sp.]|nr:alpha/beta hydrolase domain-containing protein [Ramlibacter sp.]
MKRLNPRPFAAVCIAAAWLLAACGGSDAANPAVSAPPSSGSIFNASPQALPSAYYEKEFILTGSASRYRIPADRSNGQLVDEGHPYVTRAIVRAPADPARFNGTVVVEWLNVTTGQDIDFVYGAARDLLLREGYAYVGVSAQRVGVEALRKWNPARYGSLSVAASNTDPQNGALLDPPAGPVAVGGDVLAWDVFSQVGAAVRTRQSPLLPGYDVQRVIAAGESQSASRLVMYHNAIQPLHNIYQGFLLYDRGGTVRTDTSVKLLAVGTEFTSTTSGAPQPDDAHRRWWEIAGASHVSLGEMDYLDPMVQRDGVLRAPNGQALSLTGAVAAGNCQVTPIWSRVPNAAVVMGALSALNSWIKTGTEPAKVDRLVMDSAGKLARDSSGRVAGGLRTAAYDAPMSRNTGVNGGGGFCILSGSHVDFTPAELCSRYGSAANYQAQVRSIAVNNVAQRHLLQEEANRIITQAADVQFNCAP